ncbi:MAG: ABC transporter ATP-binding protein [bacterium]|nr:ABC transporter ATP-binding protein [bacterium]
MIKVENVSFSYGKKQVLKDISLEIKEGKITTILGQNGCGKSTLFNIMTKNLPLKHGKISIQGNDITKIKLREFSRLLATVHQYNIVPEALTVEELVAYGRLPYAHTKECYKNEEYINRAIEAAKLTEIRHELVSNLSGGQMQRVWIAMAIAQNTKILFLDEPTTYLDVHHQIELLRLIKRLQETYQLTVVMILHEINQAVHYSDEIIALKDGHVLYSGEPDGFTTTEMMKDVYGIELEIIKNNKHKHVVTV